MNTREEWAAAAAPPKAGGGPAGAAAHDPARRRRSEKVVERSTRPTVAPKDDDAFDVDVVDPPPLLPEGEEVKVIVEHVEVGYRFTERRVRLRCAVLDEHLQPTGDYLDAFAPLPKKIEHRMKFYLWWCLALGKERPRLDRPSPRTFLEKRFIATTHIVKTNGDRSADFPRGRPIPSEQWYSTISDLVSRIDDGPTQDDW